MEEAERRQKLEEALREAIQPREPSPAEQRARARAARRDRGPFLAAAMVLSWIGLGWFWIAKPAYFFGPKPAPAIAPGKEEATLRFAMYLQRGRVDEFVARHARLPETLAETGEVEDSVGYRRDGAGYVLTGRYGALELRLGSTENPDSFLGESLRELR